MLSKGNNKIRVCFIFLVFFCFNVNLVAKTCGTHSFLESLKNKSLDNTQFIRALEISVMLPNSQIPTRVYKTEHFMISYTLAGSHRVRANSEEEVALLTQTETILEKNNPVALQHYYDTLTAPHPAIVLSYADGFELAYRHYVDTLKMEIPKSISFSNFFRTPKEEGLFHVEIAHLNETPYASNSGPIYGLALPEVNGFTSSVMVENDFLYRNFMGSLTPIIVSYFKEGNERVDIDYSKEWEKGTKVTSIHEFYHSMQFNYTPEPILDNFNNYWSELSATGMEDRLATEVNDYAQYLSLLYFNHSTYSTNSRNRASYGHGLFHQYLTVTLGKSFDVSLWQGFKNGLTIDQALEKTVVSFGFDFKTLYTDYTRILPFTRKKITADFFRPFNPDQDSIWPAFIPFAFPSNNENLTNIKISLPSLSYEMIDLTEKKAKNILVELIDTAGVTFVYNNRWVTKIKNFNLFFSEDTALKYIVLTNPNLDKKIDINVNFNALALYPNPVSDTDTFLTFLGIKSDKLQKVEVFDIFLSLLGFFEISKNNNTWDLTLNGSTRLASGNYYYKLEGFPYLPFVIKK